MEKALKSFQKGTAPGGSGLRAQHLVDAINCGIPFNGEQMLKVLTRLVNHLLSGNTPNIISNFIAGSPLIALKKKNGDIRQIAIGETFRRLSSKCFKSDKINRN